MIRPAQPTPYRIRGGPARPASPTARCASARALQAHGCPLRCSRSGGALRGPFCPCQTPAERPPERTAAPLPLPRAPAHPGLHSGRRRAGHQLPGAPKGALPLHGLCQPPPPPALTCRLLVLKGRGLHQFDSAPQPLPPPRQPAKPQDVVPVPMTALLPPGRVPLLPCPSFAALFAVQARIAAPTYPRPLTSCCRGCHSAGRLLSLPGQPAMPCLLPPFCRPPAYRRWRRPTLRMRCSSAPRCATCCARAPAPLWCASTADGRRGGALGHSHLGQAAQRVWVRPSSAAYRHNACLVPSLCPCNPATPTHPPAPRCTTTLGAAL